MEAEINEKIKFLEEKIKYNLNGNDQNNRGSRNDDMSFNNYRNSTGDNYFDNNNDLSVIKKFNDFDFNNDNTQIFEKDIYNFIDQPYFNHDFTKVEYLNKLFDLKMAKCVYPAPNTELSLLFFASPNISDTVLDDHILHDQ